MKRKKILYLDQFAVSNTYNAAPTSLWGQLSTIIIEKVNEGILSCPMPLEHLYETLGRSNIDEYGNENVEYSNQIAQQHRFFCEIANGTAFYGYEEIAATEIMMLLRQGYVKSIQSMYFHKAYYADIELLDVYTKGHTFNKENHFYNQELFKDVNGLREAVKKAGQALGKPSKSLALNDLCKMQTWVYIDGLKELCRKGEVKVRGVQCGDFNIPNKVDLLLKKLCDKRIDKRLVQKLIRELEAHGFEKIPSMNIRSSLNAEMAINGKKQTPNDEIDIDRAAIGLRISDYFFADNEKKLAIERCQLDEKYQTKVYSAKKDSVSSLITELSEL